MPVGHCRQPSRLGRHWLHRKEVGAKLVDMRWGGCTPCILTHGGDQASVGSQSMMLRHLLLSFSERCKAMRVRAFLLLVIAVVLVAPARAVAGMPSVLTEDFQTVFRLNESPHERFQAISFFLLGVLVSTWVVRVLWNYLTGFYSTSPPDLLQGVGHGCIVGAHVCRCAHNDLRSAGTDDTRSMEEERYHLFGC